MRPLEEGTKTDVTYFLRSDPGGLLPAWIIDRVNRIALPDVIHAVEKRMTDSDYDRLNAEREDR